MFGNRRRRERAAGPAPDPSGPRHDALPMLSTAQSRALHELVVAAFGARGIAAETAGDGVVATATGGYGLHNVAVLVADAPWPSWAMLVDNHVAALVAADADGDRPVREDMLLLKVRGAADLEERLPDFDASSSLPGLLALPAVDYPTHVREILAAEHLAPFGGWARVREIAAGNLRALPAPEHQVLDTDPGSPDAQVHVFAGEDFFVASRVLVLDHLLASSLGVERPAHGCLVAVPNRHLLAVHVLAGAGVVPALQALLALAEGECGGQPGPVSPEVYFVSGGVGQQVTRREPDEPVAVVVDGAFEQAMTALGLLGGG